MTDPKSTERTGELADRTLGEEILLEPAGYTEEPIADGPQDDLDDDQDAVREQDLP